VPAHTSSTPPGPISPTGHTERTPRPWGHTWGMVHRTIAGTSGLSRTPGSCHIPRQMFGASGLLRAGFFLTRKYSPEHLGVRLAVRSPGSSNEPRLYTPAYPQPLPPLPALPAIRVTPQHPRRVLSRSFWRSSTSHYWTEPHAALKRNTAQPDLPRPDWTVENR
jgi:hypothetical protein